MRSVYRRSPRATCVNCVKVCRLLSRLDADVRRTFVAVVQALQLAGPAAQSSPFVFQNNFWVNLHQFLRGEIYRRGANLPLGIDPMSLSEMDRTAWESAIEVYVDVAKGDLVFDEKARRIANTLSMAGDAVRLREGLLDAPTTTALNAAAPIYRARLWPARQRDNETWNASAKALVDRHETSMAAALAKVYGIT